MTEPSDSPPSRPSPREAETIDPTALPNPASIVDKAMGDRPIGARTVAVLPLGATEQHGPHLGAETDWVIADAMAGQACERSDADVLLLPAERVGYSPEHLSWGTTRSLAYADAIERWLAFAEALAARGVMRLLLLNAHGGNAPLMTIVATEARRRLGLLCVTTSWTRHGDPAALAGEAEKAHGIHAGLIETSVMLALRPDLVRMERAQRWPSLQQAHEARFLHLRAYGPHAHGWMMEDLHPSGAVGNAMEASAALGHALIEGAATGIAQLIEEVAAFDPSWFDSAYTERSIPSLSPGALTQP